MVQGTGSDVGKSLLVAGMCRAFMRRGLAVRPFKPQNMSNNAAVTGDGGEIGRAQALQAQAAGVPLSVHMNPVLLKPQSETGAQVVVQGRAEGTAGAGEYHRLKPSLLPRVMDSFRKISAGADLVLVEGAGSPAEVNLRESDIANMGFAEAADVPVVLVGDIERGGVIASMVGTHALLSASEQGRIKGFIVNKFRGDPALFDEAMVLIAERTGWPGFGLVPFFADAARLPKEDAMALDNQTRAIVQGPSAGPPIRIAVPRLARIANFDDLDPLISEDDVAVEIVEAGSALPGDADLIVLPGSKSVLADLEFLKAQGWDVDIQAHVRRGGMVVGLCGGYQMLGRSLSDPHGIEGPAGEAEGLGFFDIKTVIEGEKTLRRAKGVEATTGQPVDGYEMHMGVSRGVSESGKESRHWLVLEDGGEEGSLSDDGRIMGSYLHGIFAADGFRHAFLQSIRRGRQQGPGFGRAVERTLDGLAGHLEEHLDLDGLLGVAQPGRL
ncbi:MAG: cobyric acid synthase [Rhodospirillales bacterium]